MTTLLKKLISLILSTAIILSACCITAYADESESSLCYKGVFCYRPSVGELFRDGDSVDYYVWSDDYFRSSGKEYNCHLATMSLAMAAASVSSNREPCTDEGYARMPRNVSALLEDIGFSQIALNEDYQKKPEKSSIGVACARKTIADNGKDYTLIAVIPRSAGYEAEWGDNFLIGAKGDAKGFGRSAEKCLQFMKDYIGEQKIKGDIKVWIPGFSRGAAIADLIAKKLIDAPEIYLGESVSLSSDDLYAYTFAAPKAAHTDHQPRDEKYAGIFNRYVNTELASAMAPAQMGFERYGMDRLLYSEAAYEKMLTYFEICNPELFNTFMNESGSAHFKPKKISYQNNEITFVDDDDSYIPSDISAYLDGLCAYLTQTVGGREQYAAVYEQPLSDLIAYILSLTLDSRDTFMNALSENEDTLYLAAACYAYFMDLKKQTAASTDVDQLASTARNLTAITQRSSPAETGISAITLAALTVRLIAYLNQKPEEVKATAADYLKKVLADAMTKTGATDDEIAALTSPEALNALVHLLSHLVFGNIWQSDEVKPYSFDNEQFKNAATLIGNFMNLFFDHLNEHLISWLRTEDSYFDDYSALTDAQIAGYRRVTLRSDTAAVNGTILDSSDKTVGEIENSVLTDSADQWIGFTQTDDGGFLRIPLDRDYRIVLNAADNTTIRAEVREYSCYSASAEPVFAQTADVDASDRITLILPSLSDGYTMPSGADYRWRIDRRGDGLLGDADTDSEVTVIDATAIQRHLAELSLLSEAGIILGDVDRDDTITILDATAIQRWLAGIPGHENIGKPISPSS